MRHAVISIIKAKNSSGVVLVKRRDAPVWVLPGGGIDDGETPEEAVVRESFEETGLIVKITRKVAEYTPLNSLCSFTHVYECSIVEGSFQTTEETNDIGCFPIEKLPATFFIVHKDWLEDALLNIPTILYKSITRVTYKGLFLYFLKHPILVLRAILSRLGMPFNT